MDTQDDVAATVLLHSSEKAKRMRAPVRIALNRVDMGDDYFDRGNTSNMAYAVLFEGIIQFTLFIESSMSGLPGQLFKSREEPDDGDDGDFRW